MAYSVFRMKDENIFVRHLKGCEIMGAATNILSDKTGTLTQNKMKVTKVFLFDSEFTNCQNVKLSTDKKKYVAEVISRNTTAFSNKTLEKTEIIGNKTEGAMLELIDSWGFDYRSYRNQDLQMYQFAFNSNSKRMTTVYNSDLEGVSVYSKGAAESILNFCEYYYKPNGEKEKLTQEKRFLIREIIKTYSNQSLRVLGLASIITDMQSLSEKYITQDFFENKMSFIGLVAIEDPLRPEARISVIKTQQAGIIVRMVTGDKLETAISIAKQSNILPDTLSEEETREYVMKGKHFRQRVGGLITLTNEAGKITGFKVGNIEEFKLISEKLRVIARCSPEDKLLLVVGLKELGEVVAVTGDGSNDAAALKQSDIGLAMMSGTQLAKESSDIILLDDNFESVVNSVK